MSDREAYLTATLSALRADRAEIEIAIAVLERRLAEESQKTPVPASLTKATQIPEPRTKLTPRPEKTTARPTPASTEAILAALKSKGEMSPGQLATSIGFDVKNLRYHLNRLIAEGRVKASGATSRRRVSLAS